MLIMYVCKIIHTHTDTYRHIHTDTDTHRYRHTHKHRYTKIQTQTQTHTKLSGKERQSCRSHLMHSDTRGRSLRQEPSHWSS